MTNTMTITNDKGREFTVRVVCEGGEYGRDDCLIHDGAPMVEFYDRTYANKRSFGPRGQFVSRYYLSTLQEGDLAKGIVLDGGHADLWTISAYNRREAIDFALAVAEREGALYPENMERS